MKNYKNVVSFYDNNAKSYATQTLNLTFDSHIESFMRRLPPEGRVLDVGCGAGRDLKHFKDNGFNASGLDISNRLAEIATKHSGCCVVVGSVLDMVIEDKFDGVWASASLLHLTDEELSEALQRILKCLKVGGIFSLSLKVGEGSKIDSQGRYMNYHKTAEVFCHLADIGFSPISMTQNKHSIPGRDEMFSRMLVSKRVRE